MVAWCPRSDKWLGNRSSTVPTCKRLSEGRTICCSSGACTGCCHTAEKAHALSSTMMTTRDVLKECTRSRTGRLSHERWRVTCGTMRMEEAPPIRVQVKNVLGASAVRSCAAGGACMTGPGGGLAGHTRSARGDAAEGLACPARGCTAGAGAGAPSESSLSAKLRSRRSRLDIRSWRLLLRKSGMPSRSMLGAKPKLMYNTCEAAPTERFHCSARCVESTCLFRLGGIRD